MNSVQGSHIFVGNDDHSPEYVGVSGLGPCIGLLIYCPDGTRVSFHFQGADLPGHTIGKYKWEKGCRAIIAGGDNEFASRSQLLDTMNELKNQGIELDGVVSGKGVYVDRYGDWGMSSNELYGPIDLNTLYPGTSRFNPPNLIISK